MLIALVGVLCAASPLSLALEASDPVIAAAAALDVLDDATQQDDDGSATNDALRAIITRAKHPLVRDLARHRRIAERLRTGDDTSEDIRALGSIAALACTAPLPNTGGAAFMTDAPADDVTRAFNVPLARNGAFDIDDQIIATSDVRVRCFSVVRASKHITVALRTASTGPVAVWHGSKKHLVLVDDADHAMGFDQGRGLITLPRGVSVLTIELSLLARGGQLSLRLTNADGSPLSPAVTTAADVASLRAAMSVVAPAPPPSSVASTVASFAIDASKHGGREAARVLEALRGYDERARPTLFEAARARFAEEAKWNKPLLTQSLLLEARSQRDASLTAAALSVAQELMPDDVDVLAARARARDRQGDGLLASSLWARVKEQASAQGRVSLVTEALAFERQRGVLGVLVEREIVQRAQSSKHRALLLLASDVLDERGAREAALEHAVKANDIAAQTAIKLSMAEVRLGTKKKDFAKPEMLELLRDVLRRAPSSHSAARRLVLLLEEQGDHAGADALVTERQRLYPLRHEPWRLASTLALVRGDREAAKQATALAASLVPDDGDLQRLLRDLSEKNDDALTALLPTFDDDAIDKARASLKDTASMPGAVDAGAFIQSRAVATRFYDNGNLQSVEDVVVVITDKRRAAGMRGYRWGYSGGRERLDVIAAERITKDGQRYGPARIDDSGQEGKENGAYSDVREKYVGLNAIDDGDVIHLRIRKETTGLQNQFGDFFGDLQVLKDRLPIRHLTVTYVGPKARPLYWAGPGAPVPVVTTHDDVTSYTFRSTEIEGMSSEEGMPPMLELMPYLAVSTYDSWGALGVWYEALIKDQLTLDDELRRVAARIKGESAGERDLVRRMYEHVITTTRYVGIELGIHGWKPYPVTEVYRRRFGDCKDKASLLVALLREAGVPAHVVLVRTVQLGKAAQEPASMWAFNHAIAYVPSLDLFLDGTAERSGMMELPTMDQGAVALIVDGNNSRLVEIPVHGADDNFNSSSYVLHIQEDGALKVMGDESFRGHHNANERRRFDDKSTQRAVLERELANSVAGAQVVSIDVKDLSLAATETGYRFSAVLPKRAVLEPGGLVMPLSLYPHDLTGGYAESSTRRFDIFLDYPWRTRNVMRYVLPKGYSVVDLPKGGTVTTPYLRFVQQIEKTADGFIVDEDTAIISRRIPVASYAEFREAAIAADRLMKRKVRIQKGGAR